VSGFCGLVYQVVWLRIAMAAFGVTTPLVSIVLSVFMGGLALGSFGAGRLAQRLGGRPAGGFLRLYAVVELVIGLSGLVVAPLLGRGRALLAEMGARVPWDSSGYYLASGIVVALALLPFCVAMGATFPLAMAALRARTPSQAQRSFSYLYVANVLGALAGTLLSAFVMIELLGFRRTMLVAAALNGAIGSLAFLLARRRPRSPAEGGAEAPEAERAPGAHPIPSEPRPLLLALLFASGFASLAMEVSWTRVFAPYQGGFVYSFALILGCYLAATALGSRLYRRWASRQGAAQPREVWPRAVLAAAACALLPLLAADPRVPLATGILPGLVRVVVGIFPFCCVLGFLTPQLVDQWSGGDPRRAGSAYAVNTIGCILGPLAAGFLLLPDIGERWTLLALTLPFFAFAFAARPAAAPASPRNGPALWAVSLGMSALLAFVTIDHGDSVGERVLRRDHTATSIAFGEGSGKRLLVNGTGMTTLSPATKMMAHLPLAHLGRRPEKVLVLCFGMGTSFRSMLSWGIPTTAVELVPSVPELFSYFHPDGDSLARSPLARIVIDDARRFLERTDERFEVIVVDPPPPVEAAGSSMLYSREFYEVVEQRLAPGGMIQQWLPYGEPIVWSAVTQALGAVFPSVRIFASVDEVGCHFLASHVPIPVKSARELAATLPAAAAADLIEWGPGTTALEQFHRVVGNEISPQRMIEMDPGAPLLSDDRPVNEYFWLRRRFGPPEQVFF
jgi:predicted membrane-bound spermidine synthase